MAAFFRISNTRLLVITDAFSQLQLQSTGSRNVIRHPIQLRSITQPRLQTLTTVRGHESPPVQPICDTDDNTLGRITQSPLPAQTYGERMKPRFTTPRSTRSPRWTEEDDNKLFRLVKEGKNVQEIYGDNFRHRTFAAVERRSVCARKVARAQDRQAEEMTRRGEINVTDSPAEGETMTPFRSIYYNIATSLKVKKQEADKSDDSIIRPVMVTNPAPPKRRWTSEEDTMLYQLVQKHIRIPEPALWSTVSGGNIDGSTLLHGATSCMRRWRVLHPAQSSRVGHWTKDEERRLQEAIWEQFEGKYQVVVDVLIGKPVTTKHNLGSWRPELTQVPGQEGLPILKLGSRRLRMLSWLRIAEMVKSRSETECRTHFYAVYINADRGRWTLNERALLREALEIYGKDYWKIAEHIGTRSPTQAISAISQLKQTKKIHLTDLIGENKK